MSRATGWLGHAHGDGVEARGGELGDRAVRELRQHQGQRPRPECRREPFGGAVEAGEPTRCRGIGHMRDQRIERGAALGLIEARDRLAVGGVGAEPVDGLGRKGDEAACGQRARGALDGRATGLDQSVAVVRSLG